jgi:hypothetical protein
MGVLFRHAVSYFVTPHVVLNSVFDAQGDRTSLAGTINGTADFINGYSHDTRQPIDSQRRICYSVHFRHGDCPKRKIRRVPVNMAGRRR